MEFKKPIAMSVINDGPNTLRRKNTLRIPALIKPGSYLDEMNKTKDYKKQICHTAGGYNHQTQPRGDATIEVETSFDNIKQSHLDSSMKKYLTTDPRSRDRDSSSPKGTCKRVVIKLGEML